MSTQAKAPTITEGLARRIRETAGGWPTTRVGTDLEDKARAHGFVVSLRRVGGDDAGWQERIDVTLDVYSLEYAPMWGACEAIGLLLVSRSGYVAGGWRIDRCTATSWTEQPHPTLRAASMTVRVVTRDR